MYHRAMTALPIKLNRAKKIPLAAQIHAAIREAIETGRLAAGARLPSWRDLAVQLGVSRGTVRAAYARLIDEQFAIGQGAAGTRVAERPSASSTRGWSPEAPPLPNLFHEFGAVPLAFQMGVPSQDAFPSKLWSGILTGEARRAAKAPVGYPDPRGDPDLRKEIAAYLGIARGVRCSPSQVLVTPRTVVGWCSWQRSTPYRHLNSIGGRSRMGHERRRDSLVQEGSTLEVEIMACGRDVRSARRASAFIIQRSRVLASRDTISSSISNRSAADLSKRSAQTWLGLGMGQLGIQAVTNAAALHGSFQFTAHSRSG
jgi:DNA-binding transcriptional regulator YhcF (GntR family)